MIKPSEAKALLWDEIKCQDCDGATYNYNTNLSVGQIVGIPEPCPSCSGKGVIIEDVIMMIIGELWQSWKTYEAEPLIDEIPHLTKAMLLLLTLADILGVELRLHASPKAWVTDALEIEMITGILRALLRPDIKHKDRLQIVFHEIYCMAFYNLDIDIEKHIQEYKENKS